MAIAPQPDSWHPVHREDGELVGYVTPQDDGWLPRSVFGVPLGEPSDRDSAQAWLESVGLGYLAERWQWWSGADWITVQLVEASPSRVTVQLTDFGHEDRYGERHALSAPVDGVLRLS